MWICAMMFPEATSSEQTSISVHSIRQDSHLVEIKAQGVENLMDA